MISISSLLSCYIRDFPQQSPREHLSIPVQVSLLTIVQLLLRPHRRVPPDRPYPGQVYVFDLGHAIGPQNLECRAKVSVEHANQPCGFISCKCRSDPYPYASDVFWSIIRAVWTMTSINKGLESESDSLNGACKKGRLTLTVPATPIVELALSRVYSVFSWNPGRMTSHPFKARKNWS
jgi:hypothetical protein